MALLHVNFFSHVLNMCMDMDVILPQQKYCPESPDGGKRENKYPTMYLLHGMGDNHTVWQRHTSIERYVNDLDIAVVMPTIHLGWYTNTAYGKVFSVIQFKLQELIMIYCILRIN